MSGHMHSGFGPGLEGGAGGFGTLPLQGQQMQMRYMADQLRKELQQRSFLTHAQVSMTAACTEGAARPTMTLQLCCVWQQAVTSKGQRTASCGHSCLHLYVTSLERTFILVGKHTQVACSHCSS